MKVAELELRFLDYWVVRALGWEVTWTNQQGFWSGLNDRGERIVECSYRPSELWEHGGPIIQRECIGFEWFGNLTGDDDIGWVAAPQGSCVFRDGTNTTDPWSRGPTPLIAAMRCLVASKFGEEVPNGDGYTYRTYPTGTITDPEAKKASDAALERSIEWTECAPLEMDEATFQKLYLGDFDLFKEPRKKS